jgi:centromere/kinetochore protein ZW10
LLNSALEEIIQRIVGLADISAEAAGQFSSLLGQIKTRAPQLFSPESEPSRYVKRWAKFLELVVVLDASLREIEERWGEGQGRLAQQFPPEEVKMLIRAIFQNTERRAAVLAKIK